MLALLAVIFSSVTWTAAADSPLKVAMAQFDPIAGDMEYNFNQIVEAYERAEREGADLLVTPELALEGYTYGDYFERPEVWDRSEQYVARLQALTRGKKTALLVGHILKNPKPWGKPLQNVASAFEDGKLVHRHAKMLLPDYDVFNDARWFDPGTEAKVWSFRGRRLGIAICEDWWYEDKFQGAHGQRRYYAQSPVDAFAAAGVDLGVSLSASPYGRDKQAYREDIHAEVARKLRAPFIWAGMSGATDSILFDGRGFILDAKGRTIDRLGLFKKDYALVSIPSDRSSPHVIHKDSVGEDTNPPEEEVVLQALLTGIREYLRRTGGKGYVIGISGGIDSALTAALAALAVGPENLRMVSLPSVYSPDHSKTDAYDLARALEVPPDHVDTIPIQAMHDAFRGAFGKHWSDEGIIDENTQARIRMTVLNGIANRYPGYMVAVTGNKTEYAMGYFTFGGDDKGSLGFLGGLWKSEVYALSRYINRKYGKELIPWNSINKAASADLKPGQTSYGDSGAMPPYAILDPLLMEYFEFRVSKDVLHQKYRGLQPARPDTWVYDILRHAEMMDYKRRQAAPLLRVDRRKTFSWEGRRVPIAKACAPALKPTQPATLATPITNWFESTLKPIAQ